MRYARATAFTRGVLGGHRGWLAVAVVLWFGRVARSVIVRSPEIATTETLHPGERIIITALAPEQRRRRRR